MAKVKFPELDWKVDVSNLPRAGSEFWFEADNAMLLQLADPLDLAKLNQFAVRVKVTPRKKRNFHVTGTLEAAVVQSCVVTLKPVPAKITGAFDRLLVTQEGPPEENIERLTPREVVFDPIEDDPPDIFVGNTSDIGSIALEELALLLDPYPRHDSAGDWLNEEFSNPSAPSSAETKTENPFAALSKLKSQ